MENVDIRSLWSASIETKNENNISGISPELVSLIFLSIINSYLRHQSCLKSSLRLAFCFDSEPIKFAQAFVGFLYRVVSLTIFKHFPVRIVRNYA